MTGLSFTFVDWGAENIIPTQSVTSNGGSVEITSGRVTITFSSVAGSGGQTTITPISPQSAGELPSGFVLGGFAYQISTTSNFTPPAEVCFTLPADAYPNNASWIQLRMMHFESGVAMDVTTTTDFPTRKICGSVTSFSPFVIAQQVDPALPNINGLLLDNNDEPMHDFPIALTGDATQFTSTDVNGHFSFVNLTQGGNYVVTPTKPGYLYDFPYQSYIGISGEKTVVFTATQAAFSISGSLKTQNGQPVAGATVDLTGITEAQATTDPNGNYSFTGLPANGFFNLTASFGPYSITPSGHSVTALQDNLTGVDFTLFGPTAASASISGRVVDSNGRGIGKVSVTVEGPNGERRRVLTGTFGYYRFDGLAVGQTYIVTVAAKRYVFDDPTRVISLFDNVSDADFVGHSP